MPNQSLASPRARSTSQVSPSNAISMQQRVYERVVPANPVVHLLISDLLDYTSLLVLNLQVTRQEIRIPRGRDSSHWGHLLLRGKVAL